MILTAEYDSSHDRQSWEIDSNDRIILGRSVDNDCCVSWDPLVSRQHAELTVHGPLLRVRCLPGVPRPISVGGRSLLEASIANGESFQIGRTLFSVGSVAPPIARTPRRTSDLTWQRLSSTHGRLSVVSDNASRLKRATDEVELAERGLQILRQVLTSAHVIAVVKCHEAESGVQSKLVCSHTAAGQRRPLISRSLIRGAITHGRSTIKTNTNRTDQSSADGRWAFCVPMKTASGEKHCIYVAGRFAKEMLRSPVLAQEGLRSDIQLTEFVCQLMESVYSSHSSEKQIDGIHQFLPPCLRKAIDHPKSEPPNLQPQETDVVAIYCDLRGFSRMVARGANDLQGLLQRVSAALGIITRSIMDHQGVISDFQGDSALGFWGWPVAANHGAVAACRAALQIRRIFDLATKSTDGELNGFHVGIGIASGRAIAGRIGTRDHAKIGVFGPVVNLASRLEGLTKQTGATILLDSETARAAIASRTPGSDQYRCRPIGTVRPAGFDDPVDIHELLPPASECGISDADIETFTSAVQAFQLGKWEKCRELLALVPTHDHPREFLMRQMELSDDQPPVDWCGVIDSQAK